MIFLISGASHTGKTVLAQKMLEKYHIPYLSIDHLKMGLIRSGNTLLTPEDDEELTAYLWPIVREMIKTAIENQQDLIVEGSYLPYDWQKDFSKEYLRKIRSLWLVMTEDYIRTHFEQIRAHANDVEKRMDDSGCTQEWLMEINREVLAQCSLHGCRFHLINDEYNIKPELWEVGYDNHP